MLYLVGAGLYNESDLSIKALAILKKCSKVYIELYTNISHINIKKLEKLIGKKIIILKREEVEESNTILKEAKTKTVALLISGDPLAATTHSDLILNAKKEKIKVEIIHGSSIFTAVAETGLFLYRFGQAVSLPMPKENYKPSSPIQKIEENLKMNLHTLILLDIGMEAKEALHLLIESKAVTLETKMIVCSHFGKNAFIKYDSIRNLMKINFGELPHSLILPAKLNFKEEEFLELFK